MLRAAEVQVPAWAKIYCQIYCQVGFPGIIPLSFQGKSRHASVAQLDRALVFGTRGCRFESCRACFFLRREN